MIPRLFVLGRSAGGFLLLLGLLSLLMPWLTGMALELLLGLALVLAGSAQTVSAWMSRHYLGFLPRLLFGLLALGLGLFLMATPGVGVAFLTLLLAGYFVLEGTITLVAWRRYRPHRSAPLMLASGLLPLVLAVVILWQWPASSRYLLGILIGIKLMATGLSMLLISGTLTTRWAAVEAAELRRRADDARPIHGEDFDR